LPALEHQIPLRADIEIIVHGLQDGITGFANDVNYRCRMHLQFLDMDDIRPLFVEDPLGQDIDIWIAALPGGITEISGFIRSIIKLDEFNPVLIPAF
jgi:hypothetical protein